MKLRLSLVALSLLLGACGYSNPHDGQELEPVTRFVTKPAGAKVLITRLNLSLETPCDLPYAVELDDELVVTHADHETWRGTLQDVPQIALGTYELTLRKRG